MSKTLASEQTVSPTPQINSTSLQGSSAVLIANPAAGRGRRRPIERAVKRLREKGFDVEPLLTRRRGDGRHLAREAAARGIDIVIVAGGDGTINEAANGIAGTATALGIIPMGTVNVLASELGIPANVERACDVIAGRHIRPAPIGRLEFIHGSGSDAGDSHSGERHYFVMMAGIGFDAEAVRRVSLGSKEFLGRGEYVLAGLRAWMRYAAAPIRVSFDDGTAVAGYSLIASNIRHYAGRFPIAPDGELWQPYLNVCVFRRASRVDVMRYLLAAVRGRHVHLPDVVYRSARSIVARARIGAVPAQVDGDFAGYAPARVSIAPETLRLCVASI